MTKKDKIIAWILILQGVGGLTLTGWLLAGSQISTGTSAFSFIAACVALVAGIGSLNHQKWAVLIGILVFAAETLILTTPLFAFYIWLPFHIDIKITWAQYILGVNLVGLFLLIWSIVQYRVSNLSHKGTGITIFRKESYGQVGTK